MSEITIAIIGASLIVMIPLMLAWWWIVKEIESLTDSLQ
jgi:hypothetical protein